MTTDIRVFRYELPTSQENYRHKQIKFGNGFMQRAEDGINRQQIKWNVTFPLIQANDQANGFIHDQNLPFLLSAFSSADPVVWRSPDDPPEGFTYIVNGEISRQYKNDTLVSIEVTLERVYGF